MRFLKVIALPVLMIMCSCAGKTICANGSESFRPVLDPANSCKVRIRQVIVGTDVKLPASIALDGGNVNWAYDWSGSEFKNGQIDLGHVVLKPEAAPADGDKK